MRTGLKKSGLLSIPYLSFTRDRMAYQELNQLAQGLESPQGAVGRSTLKGNRRSKAGSGL